jgi:hypothetical protein
MNFKYTASIGILLLLGIGFPGLKSADAKSPSAQPPVPHSSTDIKPSQSSSYTVAQTFGASPIYATWRLIHSFDGIVHESNLRMNGRSGVMRTRYFNPITRRTEVVRQNMVLKPTPRGLMLIGSNPVYDRTSERHPTYVEDNFSLSIQPDGSFIVLTCDRLMRCSDVDLEVIR